MSLARLIEIPPPFSLGRVGRLCNRSCNTILYISSVLSLTLRLHVLETRIDKAFDSSFVRSVNESMKTAEASANGGRGRSAGRQEGVKSDWGGASESEFSSSSIRRLS